MTTVILQLLTSVLGTAWTQEESHWQTRGPINEGPAPVPIRYHPKSVLLQSRARVWFPGWSDRAEQNSGKTKTACKSCWQYLVCVFANSKDAINTSTLLMALVLLLGCLLKHSDCSCNAAFHAAARVVFFEDQGAFQSPAASCQSIQPLCWAKLSWTAPTWTNLAQAVSQFALWGL